MPERLNNRDSYVTIEKQSHVLVARCELEEEHRNLLQRIHQLRRLLGYPPLPTGKQQRRLILDSE